MISHGNKPSSYWGGPMESPYLMAKAPEGSVLLSLDLGQHGSGSPEGGQQMTLVTVMMTMTVWQMIRYICYYILLLVW